MKEQVEFSRFSGFISGFPGSEKVKHSAIHSRRSRHEIIVLNKSRSLAEIKKKIDSLSGFRFVDDSSKMVFFLIYTDIYVMIHQL